MEIFKNFQQIIRLTDNFRHLFNNIGFAIMVTIQVAQFLMVISLTDLC